MDIVGRGIAVFVVLYLLMRVVGKRELSALQPFDLIMLVVLGDLVQQGITQSDYSVTGLLLAAGTVSLCAVGVSYASFRFRALRPVLDGEPIILVQDGKPIDKNLRRERITKEEIAASARVQQIESLDQIRWAVLETNGQISFIKTE